MRNFLLLGSAMAFSWVAGFVGHIALRRTLGPDAVGAVAVAEGVAALAVTCIGFGLETHVRREVAIAPERALEFARALLRLRLVLGAVLTGVFVAAAALAGSPDERIVLAGVSVVAQVAVIVSGTGASYLHAVQRVGGVTAAAFAVKATWLVLVLVVLRTPAALVAAPVALFASETMRALWLDRLFRRHIGTPARTSMRAAAREVRASMPYYVDSLTTVFNKFTVPSLLGWLAVGREAGFYSTAGQLMAVPFFVLPLLTSVVPPVLAQLHGRDPRAMWAPVRRLCTTAAALLVPFSAANIVAAHVLVTSLYGTDFEPAVDTFVLLTATVPATVTSVLLASALVSAGRGWVVTRINVVTLLGMVLTAVWLISASGGAPGAAATAGAAALATWEWITVAAFWGACGLGVPDRRYLRYAAPALAGMACLVALQLSGGAPVWVTALAAAPVAAATPAAARDGLATFRALMRS